MPNILAIGPVSGPVTGQSKAFTTYVNNTNFSVSVVDKYIGGGLKGFIRIWVYLIKVFYFSVSMRNSALYITTSRTKFGYFLDLYAVLVFRLFNTAKVVNHLHGADFLDFRRNMHNDMVDFLYNRIDMSIVLSNKMKEQYTNYKEMHVVTIPNFSSVEIGGVGDLAGDEKPRPLKLLYLSNLMYSKGVFHLLSAVESLQKKGFEITLDVAGRFMDDEYKGADVMAEECKKFWSSSIRHIGVVTEDEIGKLLASKHVMCLPTFYKTEAQPLCLIEALSHGLHVLTTNHNYNLDFLHHDEAGISIVEKESVEAIFDALKALYENGISASSRQRNFRHYKKNFTLKKYISNIDGVLK